MVTTLQNNKRVIFVLLALTLGIIVWLGLLLLDELTTTQVPHLLSASQLEKGEYTLRETYRIQLPHVAGQTIQQVIYSADSKLVAASYDRGLVLIYENRTGKLVSTIPELKRDLTGLDEFDRKNFDYPTTIKFSYDSKLLARSGSGVHSNLRISPVEVFDVVTGNLVNQNRSYSHGRNQFFPSKPQLVVQKDHKQLLMLDPYNPAKSGEIAAQEYLSSPNLSGSGYKDFKFINDSTLAVLVGRCTYPVRKCNAIWGLVKVGQSDYYKSHDLGELPYWLCDLTEDGLSVLCSTQTEIRKINGADGSTRSTIPLDFTKVEATSNSSDGQLLAVANKQEKNITVLALDKGRKIADYKPGAAVLDVKFIAGKLQIASLLAGNTIVWWDLVAKP